jgi:hypothetical protein
MDVTMDGCCGERMLQAGEKDYMLLAWSATKRAHDEHLVRQFADGKPIGLQLDAQARVIDTGVNQLDQMVASLSLPAGTHDWWPNPLTEYIPFQPWLHPELSADEVDEAFLFYPSEGAFLVHPYPSSVPDTTTFPPRCRQPTFPPRCRQPIFPPR